MRYRLYSSLCPVTAVQVPIPDGLADVDSLYLLRSGEVGYGAGHLEDAALGTGTQL